MSLLGHMVGKAANAVATDETAKRKQDPTWYWFTRGLLLVTLLAGWVFILVQNKFHVDPPVVVVMLAYLAVVMTVTNLWRVGAAAVAADAGDDTWGKPLGERGELEREKKQLLNSIREAEFDLKMGKLSKADYEQLNTMYRARAIEVIKALEEMDAGGAGTTREKIEREVAARLKLGDKVDKKGAKKAEAKKKQQRTHEAGESDVAEAKKPDAKTEDKTDEAKVEDTTAAAAVALMEKAAAVTADEPKADDKTEEASS